MCVQCRGDQEKALGSSLERELKMFVSRHTDVEIKPGSSARVASSTLNHWTFPPDCILLLELGIYKCMGAPGM